MLTKNSYIHTYVNNLTSLIRSFLTGNISRDEYNKRLAILRKRKDNICVEKSTALHHVVTLPNMQ